MKQIVFFSFTDAIAVLVIMGCTCCKQKKSGKSIAGTSATVDVTDLSPNNAEGGQFGGSAHGRYCPDPTIPDFNKPFPSPSIFPSTNTNPRTGGMGAQKTLFSFIFSFRNENNSFP